MGLVDHEPSRETLIAVLAGVEAALFDATYRLGRLKQQDRGTRDLAAAALSIQVARRDLVALLDALDPGRVTPP